MTKLSAWEIAGVVLVLCAATAIVAPAQTFTTLVNFGSGNSGTNPYASLVQGTDGSLYGTTLRGGTFGWGTVFKVTPSGVKSIYNFCTQSNCADGAAPIGGLVLAADGSFYGTTEEGGNQCPLDSTCGTIFKISASGSLTLLHAFDGSDGMNPMGYLLQSASGNFYGTTASGGANNDGTVFKISAAGILTTLDSFDSTDGASPDGALVLGSDGKIYGITNVGGDLTCNAPVGCGTVFDVGSAGALATLYSFNTDGGILPYGGLVQGTNGNFYGTTIEGGNNNGGTVFEISSGGLLTTLYSFCTQSNCTDGGSPYSGLVNGTDGNFYGTTRLGGDFCAPYGCGTIYQITPTGVLTTLHSFDSTEGNFPFGGLFQATNGIFYGTTFLGGSFSEGTIYSLNMGLGPFVTFVRAAGRVGQTGGILGEGFTGTTSVAINGIPGTFTVVSDTFIKATVPAGATTGYVTVTTHSGTLTSNVPFHVIP
jgi:uncharacterized repeat protein (TIGR03803 family)